MTFSPPQRPSTATPGTIVLPPGITWNADNGATVTTLAPWQPDPKGPPNATPYGVPFSGYIRSWPQAWDPAMLRGVTEAAVTDAWTYCNGNLQPILLQEIINDAPYGYWPLIDPAGSSQASNYATNGNSTPLTVTISKYGAGGCAEAFGQNTSALLGTQGTVLITSSVRAQASAGMWGVTGLPAGNTSDGYSLTCTDTGMPLLTSGVTYEIWVQPLTPLLNANAPVFLTIASNTASLSFDFSIFPGGPQMTDESGNTYIISNAPVYTGTAPPLIQVVVSMTQTAWTGYLNGVQTASGTFTAARPPQFPFLAVNGGAGLPVFFPGSMNGYFGHAAVFPGLLTPERVMTHYAAGVTAMTGDTPDARIERLLQAGNNYPGPRVILQDTGTSITPCASCQDIAGQPAATSIQNIAASTAPAVLAVSPGGYLTYLSRGYTWNQPVRWVLGNSAAAGEIPFTGDVTYSYDPLRLINDVQLTQLDNQDIVTPQPPVSTTDYVSQEAYGDQPYWVTGYLENDLLSGLAAGPGLLDLANWIGNVNAVPGLRIGGVTVDAATHPPAWPFFMTVAKGDIVTVNWRPPTAQGLLVTATGRVSQTTRDLKWSLDGCAGTVSLLIDVAPETSVLTWDDPVRGQLTGTYPLAW